MNFSCAVPPVTIVSVLLGSFLTSVIAYLIAAGPSARLACTVLCPNTDLSPNTRTLSASRLPPTHFLTFFFKSRSDLPQFSAGLPLSNYQRREAHGVHSTIHFTTVMQSDRMIAEPFVFTPAEQIQLEIVPGTSNTTIAVPAKTKSKDMPGSQTSWLRPD